VTLPDTYVTGTPVTVDFTADRSANTPCAVRVSASSFAVSGQRALQVPTDTNLEGSGGQTVTATIGGPTNLTTVVTPQGAGTLQAGDVVNLSLSRAGNDGADICAAGLVIYGARVSY